MRLFFSLWPDSDTRARIATAAAGLPQSCRAHAMPQANLHFTLAFIGEATPAQLGALLQIGSSQRAARFTITFDACEYWAGAQVVVAAAHDAPAALLDLSMRLRRDVALHPTTSNLRVPDQPLRSHVTLARKVAQAPVLPAMSPFGWTARSFSLVRSDTSGARSAYTVVGTWPLLDERAKP